jgi:hypothetical protein
MNELVALFNDVQRETVNAYVPSTSGVFHAHFMPVSDLFKGHRFCELDHSFNDQFYSADVWIWNLQWWNGDLSVDDTSAEPVTEGGVTRMRRPVGAPSGPIPIMSLNTDDRNELDNLLFQPGADATSQSGFGWTARPFHPKPRGNAAMKDFFIQRLKDDKIPGVRF